LYEKRAPRAEFDALLENRSTRRARVDFIGVWDTVGSIGLPTRFFHTITRHRWDYHDVSLVPAIRHAAHALAIDEKRKPFQPTLWTDKVGQDQTLEQRWFVGVHSNIGGGYHKDGLANCALHWMADQASAVGLDLDRDFLKPYQKFWAHELRDSYGGIYRLMGPAIRPIGAAGNDSETLDPSVYYRWCNPDGVLERQGEPAPWRPPNLDQYFKARGIDPAHELAKLRQDNSD
jgi:hypothetical protein